MTVLFIHITLPFSAKGSSKIKSDPRIAAGPRSVRKQKDRIFWDLKRGTPVLYSRRVALERCCISSMCPTCLHLLASRPPYLQLWRRWLTEEGYCCHRCRCIRPATAAHSVQINACSVTLLHRNAMDSSFLSPIHLPNPRCLPILPHSLTQTHTLTHEEPEYKWGVFLKDMIVLLDDFLFFFNVKVRGWLEKDAISKSLTRFLWWAKLSWLVRSHWTACFYQARTSNLSDFSASESELQNLLLSLRSISH